MASHNGGASSVDAQAGSSLSSLSLGTLHVETHPHVGLPASLLQATPTVAGGSIGDTPTALFGADEVGMTPRTVDELRRRFGSSVVLPDQGVRFRDSISEEAQSLHSTSLGWQARGSSLHSASTGPHSGILLSPQQQHQQQQQRHHQRQQHRQRAHYPAQHPHRQHQRQPPRPHSNGVDPTTTTTGEGRTHKSTAPASTPRHGGTPPSLPQTSAHRGHGTKNVPILPSPLRSVDTGEPFWGGSDVLTSQALGSLPEQDMLSEVHATLRGASGHSSGSLLSSYDSRRSLHAARSGARFSSSASSLKATPTHGATTASSPRVQFEILDESTSEGTPPGGDDSDESKHAGAEYDLQLPAKPFARDPDGVQGDATRARTFSTSSAGSTSHSLHHQSTSHYVAPIVGLPAHTADHRCTIVSAIREGGRSRVLLGTPKHDITAVTCAHPGVAVKMSLPDDFDSRVRLTAQARLLSQQLPPHPRVIRLLDREGLPLSVASEADGATVFLPMELHDGDLLDWLMDADKRGNAPAEPPLGDSSLAALRSLHTDGGHGGTGGGGVDEEGLTDASPPRAGHDRKPPAGAVRHMSSGTERQHSGTSQQSQAPTPLHAVRRMAWQLVQALRHCHRHGVYHLNVNLENVLVDDAGCNLALTGFGSAVRLLQLEAASTCTQPCPINPCSAPEVVTCMHRLVEVSSRGPDAARRARMRIHYDAAKSDAWSVGAVVYALLVGRHPWGSATMADSDFAYYATTGKFREYPEDYRELLPGSDELRIVEALLDLNVGRRAGMEQAAAMLRRLEWAPAAEHGLHYGDTPPSGWTPRSMPRSSPGPRSGGSGRGSQERGTTDPTLQGASPSPRIAGAGGGAGAGAGAAAVSLVAGGGTDWMDASAAPAGDELFVALERRISRKKQQKKLKKLKKKKKKSKHRRSKSRGLTPSSAAGGGGSNRSRSSAGSTTSSASKGGCVVM